MSGRGELSDSYLFPNLFSSALAKALTEHTRTSWAVQELEEPEGSQPQEPAQLYRITFDGALGGQCFIEFSRAEMAGIAAGMLRAEPPQFTEETVNVFLEVLRTSLQEVEPELVRKYGELSVRVEAAPEIAAGVIRIAPLVATDGGSGQLAVSLYFTQPLMDSLKDFNNPSSGASHSTPRPANMTDEINLSLILDVELNLTLRFGQRKLPLRDVLELSGGSVIELDRQVDEPVELLLGDRVIARGEAVIVDGNYGLRVTEIPQPMSTQLSQGRKGHEQGWTF